MADKPRHNPARPVGVTVRSLHAIGRVEVSVDLLERNSTLREPIVSVVAPTSSEAASLAIREVDALASESRWAVRSVFGPLVPEEAPAPTRPLASALAERELNRTALERLPAPVEARDFTPAEILRRILLARTPTIASEDALTVAKLHDLVVEWVSAQEALDRHGLGGITERNEARERCRKATEALRIVAGR